MHYQQQHIREGDVTTTIVALRYPTRILELVPARPGPNRPGGARVSQHGARSADADVSELALIRVSHRRRRRGTGIMMMFTP